MAGYNYLSTKTDIRGPSNKSDAYVLSDQDNNLGLLIQSASSASITALSVNSLTITGLTGMSADSIGNILVISGANSAANNGAFIINSYISATSVTIYNSSGVIADSNNGSISWQERRFYSLEEDLNYTLSDRKLIKGTASYYSSLPTYVRPTNLNENVPTNLLNISNNTLDSKSIINKKFTTSSVSPSDTYITISDSGNLKHSDSVDITGIPVSDGYDAGNYQLLLVMITGNVDGYQGILNVLDGANKDEIIFGYMRSGASTSPNSIEIEFRSVVDGYNLSTSSPYTWEAGQPTTINLKYNYRYRFDLTNENIIDPIINDLYYKYNENKKIEVLKSKLGITNLATIYSLLSNTDQSYLFNGLSSASTVIDILNIINQQIGSRTFSGSNLTDGYSITSSFQELSNTIDNVIGNRTYTGSNLTDGYSITSSFQELSNTIDDVIGDRTYTGSNLTDGYSITNSLQELSEAIDNVVSGGLTNLDVVDVTTNYNISSADLGRLLDINPGGALNELLINLPPSLGRGFYFNARQVGDGIVVFDGISGATIRNTELQIGSSYTRVFVDLMDSDIWNLDGYLITYTPSSFPANGISYWSIDNISLNGSDVSDVFDQIGTVNYSQASAANQPAYISSGGPGGSFDAIQHDGVAEYFPRTLLGSTKSQPFGIVMVVDFLGTGGSMLDDDPAHSQFRYYLNFGSSRVFSGGSSFQSTHPAGWTVVSLRLDGTNSGIRYDSNAYTIGGAAGTNSISGISIGASSDLATYANFRWTDLVVCNGDDTTIDAWRDYFATKRGL